MRRETERNGPVWCEVHQEIIPRLRRLGAIRKDRNENSCLEVVCERD